MLWTRAAILILVLWLWLGLTALAQQPDPTVVDPTLLVTGPKEGHLILNVSQNTRVEMFPRTKKMEIAFVLYENTKPLLAQLDAQRPQFLSDAYAGSTGTSTWFMTLYVSDENVVASWEPEDNNVVFTLKRGTPKMSEPRGIYTLEDLLYNPPQRRPARPPRLAVHPLTGDAQTILLDDGDYPLASHHWKPLLGQLDRGRDLIIEKRPTIYDVDRYRYVLTTTRSKETKAVAMYQMGRTYEKIGLFREASFYYQAVVDQDAPYPANKLHMAQARVALALKDWASATTHCKNAYETGAGDLATLECLALIARGTGAPSPADIARTLANKTPKPMAHLLAAELYMMDHLYAEALELLRPLPAALRGHHSRVASAHLGDALFYTGDMEGARNAWSTVGPQGEIGGLVTQRQRILRMLQSDPSDWPNFIPEFHIEGRDYSNKSAEIHYALAQLGQVMNEPAMAVEHLHALLDRHHQLAYRTDVVSRLEYICSLRLKQLHTQERWVQEVAFYKDCWRPELNRVLYNTDMMQDAVNAYLELGMWQDAYDQQLAINAIYTRDNEDNMEGFIHLGRVLLQIGKPTEAIETIQFARSRPQSTPFRPQMDFVEGRARFELAETDAAIAAFARASTDPEIGPAASLWLNFVRAESGDCAAAKDALEAFRANNQTIKGTDLMREEVLLAYNRCLLEMTEYDSAIQLSKEISLMTNEPLYKEQAAYLSSIASYRASEDADLPKDTKANPFWEQLIKLRAETQAIEDRARGKTNP